MKISLRQLQYFQSLCEHGHFGRAAAAANVSQPALSVKIKELEETLGSALIDRTARPIAPTPFGADILARSTSILNDVHDLENAARLKRGLQGRFSLGVIPTVAPYLLPSAIAKIQSDLPDLDLHLREAQTDILLDELHNGQLDACVIATDVLDDNLTQRHLFDDRFMLAIQSDQAAAMFLTDGEIQLTDMAPLKLLLLSEGHCLREQAQSLCRYASQETLNQIGASSLLTLTQLAAGGYGATLLPELAYDAQQDNENLAVLRLANPQP
ncbi:UNVERIFIED_CONTAM: hypothetical protein GTU68_052974, partial [Idotea baltica]|nr:hypothetical protein [Idotea baltica]